MRRVVLVGGGHAHLEVLRRAARRRIAGAETVLVSPFAHHHYSSMVPGYLQREYAEPEFTFDLPALCRAAGVRFVEASAERVDGAARTVHVGGEAIRFDVASLDVGADAAGLDVPGAREHAFTIRPVSRAAELRVRVDALATEPPGTTVPLCVVGGGAAGAEVAWALHRRLATSGLRPEVTLVERAAEILGEYPIGARRRVRRLLTRRAIRIVEGADVAAVEAGSLTLGGGERLASRLTVWLTGAAPNEMIRQSALAKDPRGFVLVDATLREAGGAPVWGAGDCVTLRDHPQTPKSGVYAVREGPVLAANLEAVAAGHPAAHAYTPQRHVLSLLNTADGLALLRWRGATIHARAAWELKSWIDRRFVRKYQRVYGGRV